jgi:hypothetical protein
MRAIDADELLKLIPPEEMCIRFVVANAPTIEPKRKTGKWISNGREDCYECSECHAVIEGDEVYWRNNYFCYHCGADMRGEEMGE